MSELNSLAGLEALDNVPAVVATTEAHCVGRLKDKNGNITKYKLVLNPGTNDMKRRIVTAKQLKDGIKAGVVVVDNLTLTSDDRLVVKTVPKIIEKPVKVNVNTAGFREETRKKIATLDKILVLFGYKRAGEEDRNIMRELDMRTIRGEFGWPDLLYITKIFEDTEVAVVNTRGIRGVTGREIDNYKYLMLISYKDKIIAAYDVPAGIEQYGGLINNLREPGIVLPIRYKKGEVNTLRGYRFDERGRSYCEECHDVYGAFVSIAAGDLVLDMHTCAMSDRIGDDDSYTDIRFNSGILMVSLSIKECKLYVTRITGTGEDRNGNWIAFFDHIYEDFYNGPRNAKSAIYFADNVELDAQCIAAVDIRNINSKKLYTIRNAYVDEPCWAVANTNALLHIKGDKWMLKTSIR